MRGVTRGMERRVEIVLERNIQREWRDKLSDECRELLKDS